MLDVLPGSGKGHLFNAKALIEMISTPIMLDAEYQALAPRLA
jgi:hypothetical protein